MRYRTTCHGSSPRPDDDAGFAGRDILCITDKEANPAFLSGICEVTCKDLYLFAGQDTGKTVSTPFALGAVRAASSISCANIITAVVSTAMNHMGQDRGIHEPVTVYKI